MSRWRAACRGAASGLTVALLLMTGCGGEAAGTSVPVPVRTFVGILPHAYLVERVGGERVQVDVLVGPGQGAHVYEPTAQQIARLSQASLYLKVGLEFEDVLLERLGGTLSKLSVVDLRGGIPLRRDPCTHGGEGHDHEHHHHNERPDPHIWLSPKLLQTQARTICAALSRLAPQHASEFEKNLAGLLSELEALDRRVAERLAPYKGRKVVVYHPTYGYFCDAYGLEQVPIEQEGKEPTAREISQLVLAARAAGVTAILHEPQYPRTSVDAVAGELKARVIPFDPLRRDLTDAIGELAELVHSALKP